MEPAAYEKLFMAYEPAISGPRRHLPPMAQSVMDAHIANLARLKAVRAEIKRCIDCNLTLAAGIAKKRCVTCGAKHDHRMALARGARRRERRAAMPQSAWRQRHPMPKGEFS